MTKTVTIPLHEESMGFTTWITSPNKLDGFHTFKDSPSVQFSIGGAYYAFSGLNPLWFNSEVELAQGKIDKQVYGISENAMLAAIAIAQKPELSTTLLALLKNAD